MSARSYSSSYPPFFPSSVVRFLCCPVCGSGLECGRSTLHCSQGHAFDVARQGYVNLLAGKRVPGNADTSTMVEARERFLATGHYAALAQLLAECAVESLESGVEGSCILELGAGTGYYLARVLERCPGVPGLALDISKFAARRAARAHARIAAVVADGAKRFPVRTASAALALSIFAPRNASELHRVLGPRGMLLVATPTSRHLRELIEPLGLLHVDERKEERLHAQLSSLFEPQRRHSLELTLRLSRQDITHLAAMGPSAFHIAPAELQRRVARLEQWTEVTASFTVSLHRKSPL
jgi:23S rRNA (guanine745-N1)-methyltransferase